MGSSAQVREVGSSVEPTSRNGADESGSHRAWDNLDVDAIGWLVLGGIAVVTIVLVSLAPRFKRDQLRKQLEGTAGGSMAGVGSGFDAVWRPTAEEARADWEASVEMPAPAPAPGDKVRVEDGRLVIRVDDRSR